jgi:hypothetical protein
MAKFDSVKLRTLMEIAKSDGFSSRTFRLNGVFYTISKGYDQTLPQGKENYIMFTIRKGTDERKTALVLGNSYPDEWNVIFKDIYEIYWKEYNERRKNDFQ